MWISPEFKLYFIKEFQRLKSAEQEKKLLGWDVKRELAKVNYHIHTDAIKEYLYPTLSEVKQKYVYADEADLLNILIF
jgi:phage regulator Rha-like protein